MSFQIGNGLPDLKLQPEMLEAMRKAGFEVIEGSEYTAFSVY